MQYFNNSFSTLQCILPYSEPLEYSFNSLSTPKKIKRCWNRAKIENLFTVTKYYSSLSGKPIECLNLQDFSIISVYIQETPIKCMKKVKEICVTGSLASGAWSIAEDELLVNLINSDSKKWGVIAEEINSTFHNRLRIRSGKQCKERWTNHLDPIMKRDKWTPEEDLAALKLFQKHGRKWSKISKLIGNRTDSSIKNRVKSLLNKHKQELDFCSDIQFNLNILIEKMQQNAFTQQ